mmetsp:Transcript_34356/g.63508  ORF Transcript_34356/g.63508 Transcript_34356/m.63508 type:complete len:402 (-) Transcript_34356:16-1221(-)
MTDQQQYQQEVELRSDVENGLNLVPLDSDLHNQRSSPQQRSSDLMLPTVNELSTLSPVRTSSTVSCSTLNDTNISDRFEDSEDEAEGEGTSQRPTVKRTFSHLSNVTKRYDLTGKGYLDDTEKAMRALDTNNVGTLDMHKVYNLMKEMQEQQTVLHEQQKSFANLKKVVIALACFSMVLALANLGTAFVAATLAKDTTVDTASGALLAKGSGEFISTVSTGSVIHVEESTEPENVYNRRTRELRSDMAILGRFGGTPETLVCPHPALGVVRKKEVNDLMKNIGNGNRVVNIEYSYKNPDSGKMTRADMFLSIEESNFDDTGLHIRGTHTFPCEGAECDMVGQYRLAPRDFKFQPLSGNKFGVYSCHSDTPILLGGALGGGLDGGLAASGDDGDGEIGDGSP